MGIISIPEIICLRQLKKNIAPVFLKNLWYNYHVGFVCEDSAPWDRYSCITQEGAFLARLSC